METASIFTALIQNAALLLTMAFLFDVLTSRYKVGPWPLPMRLTVGGVVGGLGIIIMLSPWIYVPGIVFDTRSVLLGIAGLFFGVVPTAVAMAMTALFRLSQGGAAAWTGVAVICTTGTIGIVWRHHRRRPLTDLTWQELYLFGLLLHLDMLAMMLILPWSTAQHVLTHITLPVLTIYPVATTLLGMLMVNRLRREHDAAQLAANEERMRLFFEHQIVGKAITSPQKGWLQVNDKLCQMLGYSRQELSRLTWAEITHPDDLLADVTRFEQMLTGTIDGYSMEKRFLRKDGTVLWAEVSIGCVRFADGRVNYVLALLVDITARKQAEESLRLFNILVENASDAIAMATPEGKHYYQNEAFTKLFGEVGDDPPVTVYVDQAVGREIFRTLIAGGRWDGEVEMYGKDRQVLHISLQAYANKDQDGRVIGLVGVHTDITERKRTEKALRKSEERYRTLVNNLPGLAYRCLNDAHWTMLFFSEGARQLTGYPASDFLDNRVRSYASIIHPEDAALVDRAVQDGVNAHRPYEMEYRIVRADGATLWVHEKGQGIFDANGKLLWLDGVIIDINEQRQMQVEKERLQAQLLQAQKMESVGRLAGGVAHDFNNMLQTILGYCDLTLNELPAGDPLQDNLNEIRKAARRSADLTRQLLAFARKQTAAPRVLDLNDTVAGMLKMLQRLIGENIDLVWMPGHELWRVKIDPSQLDQILANLAVNARDAISDTGTITIATENSCLDAAACADYPDCPPGDYVLLTVSDNGCGMDQATLTQIFEPFFTTKEQGKGTGLGLATVYGIVRQNNGILTVASAPDQGTTFRIYLPRIMAEPADSLLTSVVVAPAGGTETVLLVEDEEAILKLGRTVLELSGYSVLVARNAAEALRLAQEHPGRIHLLITDVVMPEMNGRELSNKLMAQRPGLRCLYMSGYTADIVAQHGVLEQGMHFIQKPFTVHDFSDAVRRALKD